MILEAQDEVLSIKMLINISKTASYTMVHAGVTSRGAEGEAPLVKLFDHFGGLSRLKILVLAFQFKVY